MKNLLLLLFTFAVLFGCEKESVEKGIVNNEIVEVTNPNDLIVEYGKSINSPSKIEVKYSNGNFDSVYVNWDSIINPLIVGDYKLTGKIIENSDGSNKNGKTVSINIKVKDKLATLLTDKWPKIYLFDGYSNDGNFMGKAIESDSMDYYEKDINSLDYFYKIATDDSSNKILLSYISKNYQIKMSEPTLNSGSIAVLIVYTYRYKEIIGDTIKPIVFSKNAESILHNDIITFKGNFGDKYLIDGTLIYSNFCYFILNPIENERTIRSHQILNLYNQFDLDSNRKIDLSEFVISNYLNFSNGFFTLEYNDAINLDSNKSMLDRYNSIKSKVDNSLLSNSLVKDNNLFLIRQKYKNYSLK